MVYAFNQLSGLIFLFFVFVRMSSAKVTIYGRCKPHISSEYMLRLVKDATLCLMGFDHDDFNLDYSVDLIFKSPVLSPGFFSCDLLVKSDPNFNVVEYSKKLEEWLNQQLPSARGFENVTVVPMEDDVNPDEGASTSASSCSMSKHFKLGKCLHVVSRVYDGRRMNEDLKTDILTLVGSFFESESKGSYENLYAAAVPDTSKTDDRIFSLHVFVASKNLGAGDEACGQRMWAMCYRLEEWLNVQLFAKYPDYERSVCAPLRNELKSSML